MRWEKKFSHLFHPLDFLVLLYQEVIIYELDHAIYIMEPQSQIIPLKFCLSCLILRILNVLKKDKSVSYFCRVRIIGDNILNWGTFRENTFMYQVEAIANYFIKRGILEGNPVNPMKLQKLLYYAQGWYMGYFGEKLFNETIQAWKYGPVIEKIYHEVKAYGNYPITSCIESIVEDKPRSLSGFFSSMGIAEFKPKTPVDDQFMETTWQGLGNKDAIALSVATHEEGTPWDTVAKKYNYILPKGVVIEDDIIQNYFKTRIGK